MAEFVLEQVIRATPEQVFLASLDPELHVRSMVGYGETMVEGPSGGTFTEGTAVTWKARHFRPRTPRSRMLRSRPRAGSKP